LVFAVLFAGAALAADVNADCKNTAADTSTLQSAIIHSQVGDAIRIHGACLVNQTIVLRGNRSYLGDSRTGTIIRQASGANLGALLASDSWANDVTYTGEPIRIAHLTLDGNSAANSGTNSLVIRSWLTVVEDVVVQNSPGDGIQITSLSQNNVGLQTSQVNGRLSNLLVANSGGDGIHVVDPGNSVTDWDLLDSWIASSGKSAIYMDNAAGWKVRGNHLYGVREMGIFANRCYATAIDGNYIEDFGDSGGGGQVWYGIACTVQGGAASVISNNKVFQLNGVPATGSFVYIGVPVVNYGVGQLSVDGNAVRGAGAKHENETGLSYQLGGGAGLHVLSRDNGVLDAGTPRVVGKSVVLMDGY
jgi:hypothetical protein